MYVWAAYYRIPDNQELAVQGDVQGQIEPGIPYTCLSWNIGFGAYSDDYSFFMDGGTESRAYSAEAVKQNTQGVLDRLKMQRPDFLLLQEVDTDSTRSYHVNQCNMLLLGMPGHDSVFAQNYDSPYLFYPITEPIGASKSGILTISDKQITSSLRRSLPIEKGVRKLLDLDRCYSVSRIPISAGRELCLINLHLSAYSADGAIAVEQLKMLLDDVEKEITVGNAVICGGDFNQDLLGDSAAVFGVTGDYAWSQPFPTALLPEDVTLVVPEGAEKPVPTARNCDQAYQPGETFVLTIDGFLVSSQVHVTACQALDTGFRYTDHNPVQMTFVLDP